MQQGINNDAPIDRSNEDQCGENNKIDRAPTNAALARTRVLCESLGRRDFVYVICPLKSVGRPRRYCWQVESLSTPSDELIQHHSSALSIAHNGNGIVEQSSILSFDYNTP